MDELYLILPETHAKDWACQIPMKDDNSFFDIFPVNCKIMKIYNGKAIISLYLGAIRGTSLLADLQWETDEENPLSDENYVATNEALFLEDTWVLETKEQLFPVIPDLEGQELVGQDEAGENVYRDKIIFTTWAR